MEKEVIFRDYQEQQAQDHIDLQDFARTSFDHLVNDAVTATRKFAGFNVVKTAQTEVQIAPGRFFDVLGAVFARGTTLEQSLVPYLPAVASRIVTVSAYGVENETDVEERDFLVDVDTGRTEPSAVATVRSRDAVLVFTQGTESADPQPPALPTTHVGIANLLLDTLQVVSVTMLIANEVASTEELDLRTDGLELFRTQIEPRVASLASDLAALSARLDGAAKQIDISQIYADIARVKVRVKLPETYSSYGADNFLFPLYSDVDNSQTLGYDAVVNEGVRFSDANADESELALFSPNDPNAAYSNGLLIPKYSSILKLSTGAYNTDLGIAQYGYQSYEIVQKKMSKSRLRFGGRYRRCTNGAAYWEVGGEPALYALLLDDYTTWKSTTVLSAGTGAHGWTRLEYWWHDSWTEPYWDLETVGHTISGAQVAQSFLIANDMWATRIGFYITNKAATENITVALVEITNGTPDLSKTISYQVHDEGDIVVGWNRLDIVPTFLKSGGRYAIVLTSQANHRVGMTSGNNYADGTFFYSTDSVYYLGDLTKDMMVEVWGARFDNPQVTIEFQPINLDGGIRDVDLLAPSVAPASTSLVFEIRPSGAGDWVPLTPDNVAALTSAPALFQFRGRFIGTRDIHAGLVLTGSRVKVARPKVAFVHISEPLTLPAPSQTIVVKLLLEWFKETPHDCSCRLRVGAAWKTPTTTVTVQQSGTDRWERTFTFALGSPAISAFTIEITGATNTPTDVFHVAERIFWAL